jgi:hypothetical protein
MTTIQKIYRPSMTVGQVYAKPYGVNMLALPIGNVLELKLEHDEDVQTQDDMSVLGGGLHAEVRRIKAVKMSMKMADLNPVNLARATQATVAEVEGDAVTDEPHICTLGGLIRLAHIQPTNVTLKKGATAAAATTVTAAGNYEARAEGIFLQPDAAGLSNSDKLWVSYSYGAYVSIEALTTKAVELELSFGGMNEADSGKPSVVDVFRVSQGVTKSLDLIGKGFGSLDVSGSVLQDPTKTGAGISKYYKTSMA